VHFSENFTVILAGLNIVSLLKLAYDYGQLTERLKSVQERVKALEVESHKKK